MIGRPAARRSALTDTLPDFDALAATYERLAEPLTGPFALQALGLAVPAPGDRIVDVAAGTGALAVPAARGGCAVLAMDRAPGMVARLATKLASYPTCEARVGDCTALPCADDSLDAAFSMFGVAILPVWRAGLAEMVRVTRPGGSIVLGAWPGCLGAKPMVVLHEVFGERFPDRDFWPDPPFPAWTADTLRDALAEAGCADVAVHRIAHTYHKPDAATFVADAMPFFATVPGVAALSVDERTGLENAFAAALKPFTAADGEIRLPVEALVGIARRP